MASYRTDQGRYLLTCSEKDCDHVINSLTKVFGIVSISPAYRVENDLNIIKDKALELLNSDKKNIKTFKVETKRGNKDFPMKSPEISREVGAHILINTENIKVDVHRPETIVHIEIRENSYIYNQIIPGLGVACWFQWKSCSTISGGIDSRLQAI